MESATSSRSCLCLLRIHLKLPGQNFCSPGPVFSSGTFFIYLRLPGTKLPCPGCCFSCTRWLYSLFRLPGQNNLAPGFRSTFTPSFSWSTKVNLKERSPSMRGNFSTKYDHCKTFSAYGAPYFSVTQDPCCRMQWDGEPFLPFHFWLLIQYS